MSSHAKTQRSQRRKDAKNAVTDLAEVHAKAQRRALTQRRKDRKEEKTQRMRSLILPKCTQMEQSGIPTFVGRPQRRKDAKSAVTDLAEVHANGAEGHPDLRRETAKKKRRKECGH